MDPRTRQEYEAARKLEGKPVSSACYAPYSSLFFHTNGDVVACCKNSNYVLGNIATERLGQIWQGKRIKALRKSLSRYQFGLGCAFCEWQVRGGQYDQVYATTFDSLPVQSEDPAWPSMMEFTISNTCNLACVMCYGELSSTIRANRERLPPIPKVYDDQFFADLRQFLPHLVTAKFFGGEPFLAQENYRIWDMMIEDKVLIPCHVTTNGTQWGPRVERILEALPVRVSVSIDGTTKETVESIRVNAKFETLLENVRRFRDYSRRKQTFMSLTYCLMRQNWHEFGDYLQFGEGLDLDVFINTVITPSHCSLYTLPPDELSRIADRMAAMDVGDRYSSLKRNGWVWHSAISALRKNATDRQVSGVGDVVKANAKLWAEAHPDHIGRAHELAAAGNLDLALQEVRRAPQTDAKAFEATLLEGNLCRRLGRFAESEQAIERAMSMWKRTPLPWLERAWLRHSQGRFQEGAADAENAHAELGSSGSEVVWWVQHALATMRFQAGQKEAALAAIQGVPEQDPHYYEALNMQAWILRDLGRLAETESVLAKAIASNPMQPKAWVERAWLRLAQGRAGDGLADALEASKRLAAASPYEADVQHALAVLCESLGRPQEALQHADRLIALCPGRPDLLLVRARLREALGDPVHALADAERAIDLQPASAAAKSMAERLRCARGG